MVADTCGSTVILTSTCCEISDKVNDQQIFAAVSVIWKVLSVQHLRQIVVSFIIQIRKRYSL